MDTTLPDHTPKAVEPIDTKLTQVGRALPRPGICHDRAYSAKARGRSERSLRTLQDRQRRTSRIPDHDVRGCQSGIELNEVQSPAHNRRFAVSSAPASCCGPRSIVRYRPDGRLSEVKHKSARHEARNKFERRGVPLIKSRTNGQLISVVKWTTHISCYEYTNTRRLDSPATGPPSRRRELSRSSGPLRRCWAHQQLVELLFGRLLVIEQAVEASRLGPEIRRKQLGIEELREPADAHQTVGGGR
jgi:hypothetical protein